MSSNHLNKMIANLVERDEILGDEMFDIFRQKIAILSSAHCTFILDRDKFVEPILQPYKFRGSCR